MLTPEWSLSLQEFLLFQFRLNANQLRPHPLTKTQIIIKSAFITLSMIANQIGSSDQASPIRKVRSSRAAACQSLGLVPLAFPHTRDESQHNLGLDTALRKRFAVDAHCKQVGLSALNAISRRSSKARPSIIKLMENKKHKTLDYIIISCPVTKMEGISIASKESIMTGTYETFEAQREGVYWCSTL